MVRSITAQAQHRNTLADGSDLKPIGPPPKTVPDRVRVWWRKTVRDWPQLSRRDYQALLDYTQTLSLTYSKPVLIPCSMAII